MTIAVGTRVGSYEILGLLGAGGMGEVFRARDLTLGREVAIKFVAESLGVSHRHVSRFEQEARSASALNHPHIVTIYAFGQHESTHYLAMELVEGRSLRALIADGILPIRKTLHLAGQLAEGLAAAHEKGIVHRDLKPENVMITKEGFVKILDFGLAKLIPQLAGDDDDTLEIEKPRTDPGAILGTVGYMSPEQAAGREVDFRADQFSFGAILYELTTGRRAFHRSSKIDTLSAILHEDPEEISKFNPKAPAPLRWIIERCLAKDPGDRYSSTHDLAREIETLRERISEAPVSFERPGSQKKRPALLWIAAVAFPILTVIGVTAWMIGQREDRGPQLPERKFLAVLPFKDLSGRPAGELFSEGLSESLSARLASAPGIQVMSSAASPEDSKALSKVARDLGANLILRGAVQRAGDQIRVTYSLLSPAGGTQLAGDTISGAATDVFRIHDELAESVLRALRLQNPKSDLADGTSNLPSASQDRYLQAIGYLGRYENEASVDGAIMILKDLGEGPLVQAALARAYLYKYTISPDKRWADAALGASKVAVRENDRLPEVQLTLGELHMKLGTIEEAESNFRRALALQPNSADALLGLAQALDQLGKLEEAEKSYRRAIMLRPEAWTGYSKLGAFFLIHGRFNEALLNFQKVVQLTPDNVRGYNNLGATYMQMGRYDEALASFTKSLAIRPNAVAFSNQGTCYFFQGHYLEAAESFQRATALSPDDAVFWMNLADAYRWTPGGKPKARAAYERAIGLFERQLAVSPREASLHRRLALCYAKVGNSKDALAHSRLSRELDRANPYGMYQAAVVSNITGDQATAVRLLVNAVRSGYSRAEIERDPEMANLREDSLYRKAISDSMSGKE